MTANPKTAAKLRRAEINDMANRAFISNDQLTDAAEPHSVEH